MAVAWIREATSESVPDNGSVTAKKLSWVSPPPPGNSCRLVKLRRAILEITRHGETPTRLASLRRKLAAFPDCNWRDRVGSLTLILRETEDAIKRVIQIDSERYLRKWRKASRAWKASQSAIFSYLKNPEPKKIVASRWQGEDVVHPGKIEEALCQSWGEIESWDCRHLQDALDTLEDRYSLFMPRVDFNHTLSAHELSCAAKRASKSAAGVDGWTYAELAVLPEDAWKAFVSVCSENPLSLFSSLSSVYKRVPIPKKAGDVEPLQIRPIDVFSCLLRTHASALVLNQRRWSEKNLLKAQYASSDGVLAAVTSLACEEN